MKLFHLFDAPCQHQEKHGEENGLTIQQVGKGTGFGIAVKEEEGYLHHQKARSGNQADGAGPKGIEGGIHIAVLPELLQHPGDEENDDDAGRHKPDGGDHRPGDARHREAYIGGHIHADGPGGGLGHCHHVSKLGRGEPTLCLRHAVEKRQGCHAAAHGEKAGFEKLPEKGE